MFIAAMSWWTRPELDDQLLLEVLELAVHIIAHDVERVDALATGRR